MNVVYFGKISGSYLQYFVRFIIFSYFWSRLDEQTESDAYEPTVQLAQVGSNIGGALSLRPKLDQFQGISMPQIRSIAIACWQQGQFGTFPPH